MRTTGSECSSTGMRTAGRASSPTPRSRRFFKKLGTRVSLRLRSSAASTTPSASPRAGHRRGAVRPLSCSTRGRCRRPPGTAAILRAACRVDRARAGRPPSCSCAASPTRRSQRISASAKTVGRRVQLVSQSPLATGKGPNRTAFKPLAFPAGDCRLECSKQHERPLEGLPMYFRQRANGGGGNRTRARFLSTYERFAP
jgi:hypothetical protein